jgi:hypothetical protein
VPAQRRAERAALVDPDAGRVLFGNYAADWIEERPGLRPKTIREAHVRRWRKNLLMA